MRSIFDLKALVTRRFLTAAGRSRTAHLLLTLAALLGLWAVTGRPALAQEPDRGQVGPAALPPTEGVGNLDVVVVFDVTSSMQLDTICHDCWVRCDQGNEDGRNLGTNFCGTSDNEYSPYPRNGRALPFDYDGTLMQTLRTGEPDPETIDGHDYIILEAEFYTNNTSTWDRAVRGFNEGYWALQRRFAARAYAIDGYGYGGADNRGGFVRHHPYVAAEGLLGTMPYGRHYTLDDARGLTAYPAPRLDYAFKPTWGTGVNTYIHLRVQAFHKSDYGAIPPDNEFFWAIDNNTPVQALGGPINNYWETRDAWGWITLNAGPLDTATHTLKIWAGSTGYSIDRIIITDQATLASTIQSHPATAGSAQGMAGDKCNPIFGLEVGPADCTSGLISLAGPVNNLDDPLWGDLQPYRGASEAVKGLISRLDPTVDQAGLVTFVSTGIQRAQLECQRAAPARAAVGGQIDGYPATVPGVEYDETACYEGAVAGTVPISYHNVFIELEDVRDAGLQGGTNIAGGLQRGLHLLGVNTDGSTGQQNDCNWTQSGGTWKIGGQTQPSASVTSHCGREAAAVPAIVLLTDGMPTQSANLDPACTSWSDTHTPPYPYDGFEAVKDDPKYECVMYYASLAAAHDVPVCAIGLGNGVHPDLMQAIADMTGGKYYWAANPLQLGVVMDAVLTDCVGSRGADVAVDHVPSGPVAVTGGQSLTYTLTLTNVGPTFPVTVSVVHAWTPTEAVAAVEAPGCQIYQSMGYVRCTYPNLGFHPAAFQADFFTLAEPSLSAQMVVTLTTRPDFDGTLESGSSITPLGGIPDFRPDNNSFGLDARESVYLPVVLKQK